jgi:hypothetical protein
VCQVNDRKEKVSALKLLNIKKALTPNPINMGQIIRPGFRLLTILSKIKCLMCKDKPYEQSYIEINVTLLSIFVSFSHVYIFSMSLCLFLWKFRTENYDGTVIENA